MKTNTPENLRRALHHLMSTCGIAAPVGFEDWDLTQRQEAIVPVPATLTSLFKELVLLYRYTGDGGSLAWAYTHRGGGSNGHDIGLVRFIEVDDPERCGWWMRDPDGNTTLLTKNV